MSDQNVKGTVIRGADGKLYYIPDGMLEPYRIPEQAYPTVANTLASQGIDVAGQDEHAQRVDLDAAAALGMHNVLNIDNAAAMGMINNSIPTDNAAAMGMINNSVPTDNAAAMGMINNSVPTDSDAAQGIHNSPPADDAIASDDQRERVRRLTD